MSSGIDEFINETFAPFADALNAVIFYSVNLNGGEFPLIVGWLMVGAAFFTLYLGFISIRGFPHALRLVRGDYLDPNAPGEVTPFQALSTAISGTVGVGNIAHVAICISVGGPGAAFWLVVAGFLGMSSKFAECTLGVKYRVQNPDGSVSGGPMFYLDRGLKERGLPRLGKAMAWYYAVCIIIGSLGIGCMFQSNQAYVQLANVTGGAEGPLGDKGWLVGIILAAIVFSVIVGGIKSIAKVAEKIVPFMALTYIGTGLFVIFANIDKVPMALQMMVTGAFSPEGVAGGMLGVMALGFKRAAFSNEAGIGSASIAHAAVRTNHPATEGFVSLLEPFIDTIIVCSITSLVITCTVYDPSFELGSITGVELTSAAFASVIPWFPYVLALVVFLFAFSTMVAWSYYGLEGWIYIFGCSTASKLIFNTAFCVFVALGCMTQLDAILDFSDGMIFAMALANILGLYLLAPVVKAEMNDYLQKLRDGELRSFR
ncbi:MAG: alanine/glycine:cation symporter family protein [Deltaproteobacteria bacterium]